MLTTYENGLYIYNYKRIINISNNHIEVLVDAKKIIVDGECITVVKLLANEVMFKGKITNIKVTDNE